MTDSIPIFETEDQDIMSNDLERRKETPDQEYTSPIVQDLMGILAQRHQHSSRYNAEKCYKVPKGKMVQEHIQVEFEEQQLNKLVGRKFLKGIMVQNVSRMPLITKTIERQNKIQTIAKYHHRKYNMVIFYSSGQYMDAPPDFIISLLITGSCFTPLASSVKSLAYFSSASFFPSRSDRLLSDFHDQLETSSFNDFSIGCQFINNYFPHLSSFNDPS